MTESRNPAVCFPNQTSDYRVRGCRTQLEEGFVSEKD